MGGILGGILGGGSSPGQDAQMQGLHAARQDIQKYRPEAMQAALNAMSNASTGYQGANNALQTLWGAPQQPNNNPLKSEGYQPLPEKVMGHEMPAQVGTDPRYVAPSSGGGFSSILDPLGIFTGKGMF